MTDEKKPDDTPETTEEQREESAEPIHEQVIAGAAGELAEALDERTRDLQRITAEYHNYRKRVERDKAAAAEAVTATVIGGLLPVLDDIDRARDHGDLVGGFASVADQLLGTLSKLGLEVFGAKGDPFDPAIHEAVAHMHSSEVTETSCIDVMRRGYRIGDRLIRPAMVAVAEPTEESAVTSADDTEVLAEPTAEEPDTEKPSEEDVVAEPTGSEQPAETSIDAEAEVDVVWDAEADQDEPSEDKATKEKTETAAPSDGDAADNGDSAPSK
ncbi:hypothetical protein STSO111631_11975 [Stackebrandtia soli]